MIPTKAILLILVLLVILVTALSAVAQQSYTQDFTTTIHKD